MPKAFTSLRVGAYLAGMLVVLSCSEDGTAPSPAAPPPLAEPNPSGTAETADTTVVTQAVGSGIVCGSMNMPNAYLNDVHTGWMQGGPLSPENIISQLSGARAKGGRVVIKLCKG